MEFVMEFVMENYLWIAIGGIALLMIIIGYFAEKTDFGRKPLRNKENKKVELTEEESLSNIEEETEGLVEEDAVIEEDLNTPLTADEFQMPEDVVEESNETLIPDIEETELVEEDAVVEEDLNAPFGDLQVDNKGEEIPEDVNTPIEEQVEDDSAEDDVWKF